MDRGLCIIGLEKSPSNLRLLQEAKKRFGSVFFVPISGIGVGLADKFSITYRSTDLLKFPAVLARVPKDFCSFAYQLLSLFPPSTFMPIKPLSFLLVDERFFLLTVLRKRGVRTVNMQLALSKKAAERILEGSSFPLVIRTPEKKTGVFVKSRLEAKSIIDALASLNKPILIESPIREMVSVFVAKPEALAAVRKKTREKDIVFAKGDFTSAPLTRELKHLALEAATGIEAQVARVDISMDGPCVANIELNPNLVTPSRAAGVDITEKTIASIAENFEDFVKRPLLLKLFEDTSSAIQDILRARHFP